MHVSCAGSSSPWLWSVSPCSRQRESPQPRTAASRPNTRTRRTPTASTTPTGSSWASRSRSSSSSRACSSPSSSNTARAAGLVRSKGRRCTATTRLEAIWTAIPIAIIAIIFSFVFYKLPGIASAPKATAASGANIAITVDAHTFYWQFTYPNGATSIDELHLPVGRVAELTILSEDVNHSWWIPQLGGKTDAIPGRTNHTWYQPDKTGTFYGQCAEFCGLFHERMLGRVVVTSEAEYQSFVSAGAAKALGKAEWVGVCAKCHGMQGQGDYGPAIAANPTLTQKASLEHVAAQRRRPDACRRQQLERRADACARDVPEDERLQGGEREWRLDRRRSYPVTWKNGRVASWLVTVDHKRIGILYVVTAIFFLFAGGIMALLMRAQLATPNEGVLTQATATTR